MIVGFTIIDFEGNESAAIDYINRVCILESPEVAKNIVTAGPGINIFSDAIILSELIAQPFSSTPIETIDGKYLLVSIVNFNLELLYNNRILRLEPTEYTYIDLDETFQFEQYILQGLVKLIPAITKDGKPWILGTALWNDEGIWIDSDFWKDTK